MKKIITMILTVSIACMFAVAPAFAADNDLGIQQRKLTNRTGSTRGFRVAS